MLYKRISDLLRQHSEAALYIEGDGWTIECVCHWQSVIHYDTIEKAQEALGVHQSLVLGKAGYAPMQEAGAAALRAVADSWGSGGRRTLRLQELEEIAGRVEAGEWDSLLVWGLQDIELKNRRKAQK